MTITLYKNVSEANHMNKTLSGAKTFTGCTLRTDTSIVNPTILLQKALPYYRYYNYMYIEEFGRYYFITDITSTVNGVFSITGEVDVLYTYKNAIENVTGIVDRQEDISKANLLYQDSSLLTEVDRNIVCKKFSLPTALSNESLVLILAACN